MSTPEGELLTGTLISQVILVRALDRAGVLRKEDYIADLEHWIESQPQEKQGSDRYQPLRLLIDKLSGSSFRHLQ